MQDLSSLSFRELLAIIVSSSGVGAAIGAFFQWILQRKKYHSEAINISAQSVKIEAEARQVSTKTILEAQERIVEQGEIIYALRDALVDANRERDNFEFDLKQATFRIGQMEREIQTNSDFIKQLKAANILKVAFKDAPHINQINDDGTLKDA